MIKLSFRRGSAFASKKAKQYLETINPEDIRNICVIRHAAIGDWVATRPFLIELRKYFPNATITLSVNRSAMYGMPQDLIDEIHIVDKDDPNNKSKKTGLLSRIKQAKLLPPQDILFDLTDSSLTLLITALAQAKIKIGYPFRLYRRMFYDIALLRSQYTFESYTHLDMLSILNAHTMKSPLEYRLTSKTTNLENPYIIYFAGASMKERCWSETNYSQLIEKMAIAYPTYQHIILKGIKSDEQFLDIYNPIQHLHNVQHLDPLPLDQIYDFLGEASLVVVGDTGIRNMAIATHTPTLGIFFNLTPYKYWPRDTKHDCVFKHDLCVPTVDEVYHSTIKLMDQIYGK